MLFLYTFEIEILLVNVVGYYPDANSIYEHNGSWKRRV